jgi:hypothetical protein
MCCASGSQFCACLVRRIDSLQCLLNVPPSTVLRHEIVCQGAISVTELSMVPSAVEHKSSKFAAFTYAAVQVCVVLLLYGLSHQ